MWFFHKISFWEVELKHFLFNDDNVWLSTKSPQLQKRTKLQTWSKLHQAICVLIRRCVVLLSIFSASFFDIRLNFLWRFLNSCEWHAQIMIHWHSYFYILFFGWHFFVKKKDIKSFYWIGRNPNYAILFQFISVRLTDRCRWKTKINQHVTFCTSENDQNHSKTLNFHHSKRNRFKNYVDECNEMKWRQKYSTSPYKTCVCVFHFNRKSVRPSRFN